MNGKGGVLMAQEEKESDGKLYRVYHKKGNHQNTKINHDGTKAAIQFTKDNDLDGPLEIREVDEDELLRTEFIEDEPRPRTWKEIIVEDIVVPVAKEAINQVLEIGYQRFEVWMAEEAIPATKKKTKEIGQNMKVIFSGIKAAVNGEEPKAVKLLRETKESEKSIETRPQVDFVIEKKIEKKIQMTQEEFEQVLILARRSAGTLVGCINLLRNTAVSNANMNPQQKLELQNQLEGLATSDILGEIDLLLEEKNKNVFDAESLKILAAFREGNFVVDDKTVPIKKYIENKQ